MAMDASQIREHMKVVGPDGRHLGTVDRVEGDRIKLTKSDSSDGQHHYVNMSDVEGVKDDEVCLHKNAKLN
jgi:hypothetical protein